MFYTVTKLYLLVFLGLVLTLDKNIYSQNCLPNGIVFTEQSQIDSFPILYPNCTTVEGYIIISGDNIVNLDSLRSIKKIINSLEISNCNSLLNLSGLDSLRSIEGYLKIEDNDSIINLSGLCSLESVDEDLRIIQNNNLLNLTGLESLTEVGKALSIQLNNSLINFEGLDSLSYIGEYFTLFKNNSIKNFCGLLSLNTINGKLYVRENDSLINFVGAECLMELNGGIGLSMNKSLVNLSGLDSVVIIFDRIGIYGNEILADISALSNAFSYPQVYIVEITNNINLSFCSIPGICEYIDNGPSVIYNNAPGCNSEEEIDSICGLTSITEILFDTELTVFPSPTQNSLCIKSDWNFSSLEIEIFNSLGVRLSKTYNETNGNEININVSSLPDGLYFIKITDKEYSGVRKFVKD